MVRSKQLSNSKKLIVNHIIDLISNQKFNLAENCIRKNFKTGTYFNSFLNGWIQQLKGNYAKSIKLFERALLENPLSEDCLNGLAASYLELKQLAQAEECAEHALFVNKSSNSSKYIYATIISLKYKTNVEKQYQALDLFEEVINDTSDNKLLIDSMIGIGAVFLDLDEFELSKKYLESVLITDPYNTTAHKNLISVYSNLMEVDKAIASSKIAQMAENVESANDAIYQESMLELLKENYIKGWRLHESRLLSSRRNQILQYNIPLWQGEQLKEGQKLLIVHEQGLGDLLQFIRYIPEVNKLVEEIDLEIRPNTFSAWEPGQEPPSFKSFIAEHVKVDNILVRGWNKVEEDKYSYMIPIMSLPQVLKLKNSIPPPIKYSNSREPKWDIAIFWQGSKHHFNDKHRSIPTELIEKFIHNNPGLTFVSLQTDYENSGIPNLTANPDIVNTIEKTLEVICNSKQVITVDSMVAHLSGGTNVPTTVLLPFSPDWRWGTNRSDCLWYTNIKNIRQTKINDWVSVLEDLNNKLSQN